MRRNVWENNQRHYCSVCNAWMGSDRQSILIHENGKKHRENAEASLKKQRETKLKQEKEKNLVAKTLEKMNEAVMEATPVNVTSSAATFPRDVFPPTSLKHKTQRNYREMEKIESKHFIKKEENMVDEQPTADAATCHADALSRKRKLIQDEGYYTLHENTFLCGPIFSEIFEKDMIVEIFTGSLTMTQEYQRSLECLPLWKTGVIIQIHGKSKSNKQDVSKLLFDISYLNDVNDEDETIERMVDPIRLRLRLGMNDLAPQNLEEAELALLGGEEVVTFQNSSHPEIDENTGLSKWTSVSVRRATVNHEVKEERVRRHLQQQETLERQIHEAKEREARKLEEAKQLHSHDSALGAYDVFNTITGYKGVSIEMTTQAPQAKIMHAGPVSAVFKAGVSCLSKKRMRRTMADDSDEN